MNQLKHTIDTITESVRETEDRTKKLETDQGRSVEPSPLDSLKINLKCTKDKEERVATHFVNREE